MNWVDELIDLYDRNSDEIGKIKEREYKSKSQSIKTPFVLLPIFHTTVTAQITVTITADGNFKRAGLVDDNDKLTIIPVTNKSAGRTSGKEPHPLCDNLMYLAGDYTQYCKDDGVRHELYMEQLEKWIQSDFCHEKVKAIYLYLKKGTLIKDLVYEQVIKLNEKNQIDNKVKLQKEVGQEKAFVRFIVQSPIVDFDSTDECWKDETLWDCYIKYFKAQEAPIDLCYLTGNREAVTYLHPKKIRNEGDGAKLISANDATNFTYRGRFENREEAFAVGNESSQKFHNALKWIIRKQGTYFDTLCIVTWESDQKKLPDWEKSTKEIEDDWDDWDTGSGNIQDQNEKIALQFNRAMMGYKKEIKNTSHMFLLGFDAATSGRLSMLENKQLESARYLENIENWHKTCCWIHPSRESGEKPFWGMVGVKDIAVLLFGLEDEKGNLTIADKNTKRIYPQVARMLIPCIWDGKRIPYDLVHQAIIKASSPLNYKVEKNWKRVLALACSLVKKNKHDRKEEEWNVGLDHECDNRSYLYGRLLAVADELEYETYDVEEKTKAKNARVTNARRYMNAFSKKPYETWQIIEERVQPYREKLGGKRRAYYDKTLNDIQTLFKTTGEFEEKKKLEGLYLLGFHCQSYEIRKSLKKKEEEE